LDQEVLNLKFKAITDLNFYLRLMQNERLRIRFDTREEYEKFYASAELQRLFKELIADKLAISEIILLLREKPLTMGEISQLLNLTPSETSRHLNSIAKQGLVRYGEGKWSYALLA
jgi:DNA-binding transcriptional ArsR family regulator